jgi:hypothetical protein
MTQNANQCFTRNQPAITDFLALCVNALAAGLITGKV